MIIIGVDFHPEFQQIASVDTDTGEVQEKRLAHREEAEKFYRALAGQKVRVGMEARGHGRHSSSPTRTRGILLARVPRRQVGKPDPTIEVFIHEQRWSVLDNSQDAATLSKTAHLQTGK